MRATTFVARRRSSSTRCSSARLALLLEHRARSGAVDHRRHAVRAVQAHVGVQRRAAVGIGSPKTAWPWRCSASPAARCRAAAAARRASSSRLMSTRTPGHPRGRLGDHARGLASTSAGSSSGIMRRSSLSTTLPGTTLVLVPPSMRPTFRYGCVMPATVERTRLEPVLRVQRVEHRGRGLQRVDAGVGYRGVGHRRAASPPSAGSRCARSRPGS